MGDALAPAVVQFRDHPEVHGEEAYWGQKKRARQMSEPEKEPVYEVIEMPTNSPTGVICAFFATAMGFAMIWHIWWLVAARLRRRLHHVRRLRLARQGGA